jgi:hypothetical protein
MDERSDGRGAPRQRENRCFVLRLWRETSASEPAWRGTAYDVASAVGIASSKLRDLWDFIMLRSGADDG